MKTEQEQIEEMRRTIYHARSKVNGIATAGDIAEALVQAGYGDISEYEAEREMLGSQIKVLKQRLNNKYVEIEQLKDDYAKLQEQFAQYQMASDKEIKAQIKQAQIDVLKKLKERAIGYTFLGEKLATETDIDGLIEEVENEQKD